MTINFDKFLAWAESRFDNDVQVAGDEIKVNSVFAEDYKHHLWCNPYGGKKERNLGVYHCWKTGRKGTLPSLVMEVEGCDYEEAIEILGGSPTVTIRDLDIQVQAFFDNYYSTPLMATTLEEIPDDSKQLKIPTGVYLISDLPSNNYFRGLAESYLKNRKLPIDFLMVGTEGRYKNRVVIPYYNAKRELIYYNGRDITGKSEVRYLGPPKEIGVGKGDVVYMPKWPMPGSKIYITEGEFDSLSILWSGLNAGAIGGKNICDKQIYMFEDQGYEPILCFDNDKAGQYALMDLGKKWIEKPKRSIKGIRFVRPPTKFKDWNDMFAALGGEVVKLYIEKNSKEFDPLRLDILRA